MTVAREKLNKKSIDYANNAINFLNVLIEYDLKKCKYQGHNINYNLGQEGSEQVSSFRHIPCQNLYYGTSIEALQGYV